MADDTGKSQGIGYKKPPEETQFGKPKGNRRNNKGRPKSFDQLRKLVQKVASEDAVEGLTRVELMLKAMSASKNPADRANFLAYGWGKPKEEIDLKNTGEVRVIIEYIDDQDAETPPGTETSKE